ncbi:MAG: hypothetical protein EGR89_04035 [[Eubacterium] rectale]|nr:hypothetical protein [Agathobacter rectalis]
MLDKFIKYWDIVSGMTEGDIVGWILAAFGGIIVYKAIDHLQTSMGRHQMLKDIEDSFSKIYNSVIAMTERDSQKGKQRNVMVRSVLHDKSDWQIIKNCGNEIETHIDENQLYVKIRNRCKKKGISEEWVSSQALHEIMLLCRRCEKMYKDKIIKRIDLSDLSSEIVPLGMSGRIQFFNAYYGSYSAECVGYLVLQTVVSCYKNHNYGSVRSFVIYYKNHEEIHDFYLKSKRIRPIRDYFALKKFRKIVNENW